MRSLPAHIVILLLIASGIAACKDDPVASNDGGNKYTCDTCIVDTTDIDTTDTTVVINPNDTTSHDFVWTEYSIPGEASITGCWVFDENEIWAISNRLYRFSNGQWVHKPLKNQQGWDLNSGLSGAGLFGFSPNDAWIYYGSILWHFDGHIAHEYRLYQDPYNVIVPGEDGQFRAAWGTSSKDMFFVGDKGVIVHFDGTTWKKFPKVTEKHLRSVWGTSSSDVWASGFNSSTDESVLLHYDGKSWREDPLSFSGGARRFGVGQVWAVDSAGHRVTILSGATVLRQTDDGPWRSDSGSIPNAMGGGGFVGLGAKGNTPNDLVAAGGWGFIAHWNSRSWYQYKEFYNPGHVFYGASTFHVNGNTVLVGGVKSGSWIAIGRRTK